MATTDHNDDTKRVTLRGQANYKDWFRRVKAKLYAKELHTTIWEEDDDKDDNPPPKKTKQEAKTILRKAYTIILDLVHPDLKEVYDHVPYRDALELWDAFQEKYEKIVEIKALQIHKN